MCGFEVLNCGHTLLNWCPKIYNLMSWVHDIMYWDLKIINCGQKINKRCKCHLYSTVSYVGLHNKYSSWITFYLPLTMISFMLWCYKDILSLIADIMTSSRPYDLSFLFYKLFWNYGPWIKCSTPDPEVAGLSQGG